MTHSNMASKESLFAILSRQPWWLSVLVAGALFGSAQLFLPGMIAAAIAIPFLGIACYAGWRQMRSPGASNWRRRSSGCAACRGKIFLR